MTTEEHDMSKKTGGPAFPYVHDIPPGPGMVRSINVEEGMTLRDYFAAKAPETPDMQIFPIKQWSSEVIADLGNGLRGPKKVFRQESWAERDARWAFEYADAMIAERAK